MRKYINFAFTIGFALMIITGCGKQLQPTETLWYRDDVGFHETNNQSDIKVLKGLVDNIEWKGTEPGSLTGAPDFAFWIGRNKDNVRIIHCDIWKLDSGQWGITKTGEEFDILNRYSEITETQLTELLGVIGVNRENIRSF
ncbi:hypothetical protein [Cohnella sp. JJ-181]|uniref:hypothetical protein n=1 Tax=Cohnella rhizoplanae TaxID=2974897 RepID=UPI00232EF11E|nr:hypothetical protein [Cohnella sp. JJ-181]